MVPSWLSLSGWKAMLRLVRLPNVLIVVLTMLLMRYCIFSPYLYGTLPGSMSPGLWYGLLVLVTVVITIGGYVINDYFDAGIDRINRPDSQVVTRAVSRRAAIKIHIILNSVAILLGFFLAWRLKAISFGFIFPFVSGMLWLYSAKYKRLFFWGNAMVAALSSFVILVAWLFEFFWLRLDPMQFAAMLAVIPWVNRIVLAYALFAILISMVREIIKDMEDTEGDRAEGCRTLPIVLGIGVTRIITAVLLVSTMALLGFAQVILFRLSMNMAAWYLLFTVQLPSLFFLIRLFQAKNKADYHDLSTLCKMIMLAGILSMEIILISN